VRRLLRRLPHQHRTRNPSGTFRVTRWVFENENLPKCSPSHFLSKLIHHLYVGKSSSKMWTTSAFKKVRISRMYVSFNLCAKKYYGTIALYFVSLLREALKIIQYL
jgi:hypothetical protein